MGEPIMHDDDIIRKWYAVADAALAANDLAAAQEAYARMYEELFGENFPA